MFPMKRSVVLRRMVHYSCNLLCLVALSITATAQLEPVLASANIPMYPPLACQARIQGTVKLTFMLAANAVEPTEVQAVSGHALLKDAALENVKTWRFQSHHADGRFKTTLEYRLLSAGLQKVTFESFKHVEIVTCRSVLWQP